MSKYYSMTIRTISIITLAVFLATQCGLGYAWNLPSSPNSSKLRQQQALEGNLAAAAEPLAGKADAAGQGLVQVDLAKILMDDVVLAIEPERMAGVDFNGNVVLDRQNADMLMDALSEYQSRLVKNKIYCRPVVVQSTDGMHAASMTVSEVRLLMEDYGAVKIHIDGESIKFIVSDVELFRMACVDLGMYKQLLQWKNGNLALRSAVRPQLVAGKSVEKKPPRIDRLVSQQQGLNNKIIAYLDANDGWADKKELEEYFKLSPEELQACLDTIDFEALRRSRMQLRRKHPLPLPRVFEYGFKGRVESVIEILEGMEGRATLTDIGRRLGYKKEKVNSETIFGLELSHCRQQLLNEINYRQRLKGRLVLQIIDARKKKRQDMLIMEVEAIRGRATAMELAFLEEKLDLRRDRQRYPDSSVQNRSVGIASVAGSIDFEALNYNRRLSGRPPLSPLIHPRTKRSQDLALVALEQLGGWAITSQIYSYAGAELYYVILDIDFEAVNQWRDEEGLFPLGVLIRDKTDKKYLSKWRDLDLNALQSKLYGLFGVKRDLADLRRFFRQECGSEENKVAPYNEFFRLYVLPLFYYYIYERPEFQAGASDRYQVFQRRLLIAAAKTIISFAKEKNLSGKQLRDYFHYVAPRAINLSHKYLDISNINNFLRDPEHAVHSRLVQELRPSLQQKLQQAFEQYFENRRNGFLVNSIYDVEDEDNVVSAMERLKKSHQDEVLRQLMMPGNISAAAGQGLTEAKAGGDEVAAIAMLVKAKEEDLKKLVIVIEDDRLVADLNSKGIEAVRADNEIHAQELKKEYPPSYFVIIIYPVNKTIQLQGLPPLAIEGDVAKSLQNLLGYDV